MANRGERTERNRIVEEFVPSSAWTEDKNRHYLLLDLPGFQKEQVKLQVEDGGNITVIGGRLLNNGKTIFFRRTFQLIPNSDIDKITAKFDTEILHVSVSKLEVDEKRKESSNENGITEEKTQERGSSHGDEEIKVAAKPDI